MQIDGPASSAPTVPDGYKMSCAAQPLSMGTVSAFEPTRRAGTIVPPLAVGDGGARCTRRPRIGGGQFQQVGATMAEPAGTSVQLERSEKERVGVGGALRRRLRSVGARDANRGDVSHSNDSAVPNRLMHPATSGERAGEHRRILMVHADDLGMCRSVNRSTLTALEQGSVTSVSVMAPCPGFSEVAGLARGIKNADIGVHLTFTSEWESYRWGPVADAVRVPSLVDTDGCFWSRAADFAAHARLGEVEYEARAQIEAALQSGIDPTHIDTHMFCLWQNAGLIEILLKVAHDYKVPCFVPPKGAGRRADTRPEDIIVDHLLTAEPALPPARWEDAYVGAVGSLGDGITILIVHLGDDDQELRAITGQAAAWGAAWRNRDKAVVTGARFREAIRASGAHMCGWTGLSSHWRAR